MSAAAKADRPQPILQAVDLVMQQADASAIAIGAVDALFAVLVDHEPQKPASLIALEKSREKIN